MSWNSRQKMLESVCYLDQHKQYQLDTSKPNLEPVDPKIHQLFESSWHVYLDTLGHSRRINKDGKLFPPMTPSITTPNGTINWNGPWVEAGVTREAYFKMKSMASRVGTGLGSMGQPRYFVLVEGRVLVMFMSYVMYDQ